MKGFVLLKTEKFDDILKELEHTDPWLRELGLDPKNDRIHWAIDVLNTANAGIHEMRLTGKPTKIGRDPDFYFGIEQAYEFHQVLKAFRTSESVLIRERLKRALSGPTRPSDETSVNSDARNVMFELGFAAMLKLRGADVRLAEPDLTLMLGDVPYLLACKRPFRESSIRANVRAGADQAARYLEIHRGAFGAVVVSTSRIFRGGSKLFAAPREDYADKLGDHLQSLLNKNRRHWENYETHPRLAALLLHIDTISIIADQHLIAYLSHSLASPLGKQGPAFEFLKDGLKTFFDTVTIRI